jgi:hypothetical protein
MAETARAEDNSVNLKISFCISNSGFAESLARCVFPATVRDGVIKVTPNHPVPELASITIRRCSFTS